MSHVIRQVGWACKKKTLGATERDEDARAAWREQRKELDARKLVVIDECGSHIGLTPLYARAPKGLRAYGKVPRNRGKNTRLIASVNWFGMGESLIIEGSTTTFAQYTLSHEKERARFPIESRLKTWKGQVIGGTKNES